MTRIQLGLVVALTLATTVSEANAGNRRYFFTRGSQARYCEAPVRYESGYYAICDEPSIVRVNGCPTISSREARRILQRCNDARAVEVVQHNAARSVINNTDPVQCPPGAQSHTCYPALRSSCDCTVPGRPVLITGTPGPLKMNCTSDSFYRGIEPREATIPVPQLCVNAKELYRFKPITLDFDCSNAKCDGLNCDLSGCPRGTCRVRTCEVYECVTNCRVQCKLVPVTGPILIAVRSELQGGQLVADVVIGKNGKIAFGAYPENTVILQAATRDQIRKAIGLTVDLATISGTTNLKSLIN